MAARQSISALARAVAISRQQTRLLHQKPGAGALFRTVATSTSASVRQPPRTAPLSTDRLQVHGKTLGAAPGQRRRYSTKEDAAAASEIESKFWDFESISNLIQDPKHKTILVDVREPSELQQTGKIPGAVNIPITTSPDSFHISEDEFEDRFGYPRPAKDAEIVIYCRAGVRARSAGTLAKDAGWTNVGEYPGSWLDWAEKGGKVER